MTDESEPIPLDCSARYLNLFIQLLDHYPTLTENHDAEFEKDLFSEFDDSELVECVKQLAILDSDFLLVSVADFILDRIKEMSHQKMQEYLELEDDFTPFEREMIRVFTFEYIYSIETWYFVFPFPGINFSMLQNKFYCPLNALLSRIIQRSEGFTAFRLSMINKAMKNECDRHPNQSTTYTVWMVDWFKYEALLHIVCCEDE